MASLLNWAKQKVQGGIQTVQRDAINPVVHQTQAAVAQVNPLDSGRTYSTVMNKGAAFAPKPQMSALNQATHNGTTNVLGGIVKPLAQFPLDAGAQIYNHIEAPVFHLPQQNLKQNPILGSTARMADASGSLKQTIGSGIQTGLTIATPGIGKGISKGFEAVAPKVIPRIIPKVLANAGTGAVVGGPMNVGNYLSSNQPITKQGLAQSFKQGAQAGAVLGGGGTVAGAVLERATPEMLNSIRSLPNTVRANKLAAATEGKTVQKLSTSKLTSYEGAPDKNRVEHYKQLIQSGKPIKPIIAMKDSSGALGIEDGKHRFQAYKELGIKNVPVKVATPEDIRKLSQGGYVKIPGGGGGKADLPQKSVAQDKTTSNLNADAGQIPNRQNGLKASLPNSVTPQTPIKPPIEPPKVLTASSALPPEKPPVQALAAPSGDMQLPPEQSVGASNPAGQKQTRFSGKTVPQSDVVSSDVKQRLNAPSYTVQQEKANYTTSLGKLKNQGHEQFVSNVEQTLNKQDGTISRQDATDAITAAQILDKANDPASLERASNIYDRLSSHYTAAGQLTQSASILSRRTPQGLLFDSTRQLKRAGTNVTPELQTKLKSAVDGFKNAPQEQKDYAAAKVKKLVTDNVPQSKLQKLTSVWKAGLLSGVKTQQGNAISNATFGALKKVSDVPATAVDKGISLITGQRTKALTGRGVLQGTKEGIGNGVDTLKTGIDKRDITDNKYQQHGELNFKNPIINKVLAKPTNMVFRGMSAADQPFYYSAAKNSLYDQAIAAAKTKGLNGLARRDFVKNLVDNPSQSMAETARSDAEKAVLGQSSEATHAISQLVDKLPGGHFVAPFTKVPTNFLSRAIDFTPAGIGKGAFKAIQDVRQGKAFDQRSLSEAIGEGATGTGIIALGATLASSGRISGGYPTDAKEQQRWKAEGITENSVKLGNKWYSLNYLGPMGILLNAGNQYHQSGGDVLSSASAAAGGVGQSLLSQSFLQGVSGLSNAIQNPTQYAKSYINSQASSVVPAIVNDAANLTDKFQRQANTPLQAIENRIPGLRENNSVKQDVYGNNLQQPAGQANTLNGLKPSNSLANRNPVINEVDRLHNVDPNNKDFQVTPTPVNKSINVDKSKVNLNDTQRYNLQNKIGQATQSAWGNLIKTPEYKALDDTEKAKALSNLRTDVSTLQTRQFVLDNNLGTYTKSPSRSVQALGSGNANLASYATNSQSGGANLSISPKLNKGLASTLTKYGTMSTADRNKAFSTDNSAEYKYNLAKYNNDLANGSLTDSQKIRTNATLAKEQVGSNFSKNVRDLYSLTKSELNSYINSSSDGKAIYAQLQSYDSALVNAGIIKNAKFKYGLGTASSSGSSKQSLSKLTSTLKAANAAVKPPTPPKSPGITVKVPSLPTGYKQTSLKQYAVAKHSVGRAKKA